MHEESAAGWRFFEQVYVQYASEYIKGPRHWTPEKLQGIFPQYPGNPIIVDGELTGDTIGNVKNSSSDDVAFLALLFGICVYGDYVLSLGALHILKVLREGG